MSDLVTVVTPPPVIAPGTRALLGGIDCEILGVLLRAGGSVEYEVSWWANGDRKTAWVREPELYCKAHYMTVGFDSDSEGKARL